MAASASTLLVLKTLLVLLACVMAAALAYAFTSDYYSTCFDPRARWMQVALLDFYINVSPILAWYFYKESRWIMRVMFFLILSWFGSVGICGYILLQFFKLSPEETLKDPFYFMLARPQNRDVMGGSRGGLSVVIIYASLGCLMLGFLVFSLIPDGSPLESSWINALFWILCTVCYGSIAGSRGGFSVVTTRIIYASLGCLMLGFPVFALITDGSPFRAQVLSPCMIAFLTDISIQAVVYSVWIGYKESSWINALFWILCIVCFGSIGLCAYIVRELFYLTPEQPVYLILFNRNNRDVVMAASDPLLMHHHHGNA